MQIQGPSSTSGPSGTPPDSPLTPSSLFYNMNSKTNDFGFSMQQQIWDLEKGSGSTNDALSLCESFQNTLTNLDTQMSISQGSPQLDLGQAKYDVQLTAKYLGSLITDLQNGHYPQAMDNLNKVLEGGMAIASCGFPPVQTAQEQTAQDLANWINPDLLHFNSLIHNVETGQPDATTNLFMYMTTIQGDAEEFQGFPQSIINDLNTLSNYLQTNPSTGKLTGSTDQIVDLGKQIISEGQAAYKASMPND